MILSLSVCKQTLITHNMSVGLLLILLNLFHITVIENCEPVVKLPIVINTWAFSNATIKAWEVLQDKQKTVVRRKNKIKMTERKTTSNNNANYLSRQ